METKKVLLDVSYNDESGKYWKDSYIKNKIFSIDCDIHETIKKALLDIDGAEMSYNGKPKGFIYVDIKGRETKKVGYHYRCKDKYIQLENGKWTTGYFTAWVSVNVVSDYDFKDNLEV